MPKGIYRRTSKHRQLTSLAMKKLYLSGYKSPMLGRKHSYQTKSKISSSAKEALNLPHVKIKLKNRKRRFYSKEHRKSLRLNFLGSKNPRWKVSPSYQSMHQWVSRHKNKIGKCSMCRSSKKTQWANLNHEYRRKLEDYLELCHKCHNKYDRANNGYYGRWRKDKTANRFGEKVGERK